MMMMGDEGGDGGNGNSGDIKYYNRFTAWLLQISATFIRFCIYCDTSTCNEWCHHVQRICNLRTGSQGKGTEKNCIYLITKSVNWFCVVFCITHHDVTSYETISKCVENGLQYHQVLGNYGPTRKQNQFPSFFLEA